MYFHNRWTTAPYPSQFSCRLGPSSAAAAPHLPRFRAARTAARNVCIPCNLARLHQLASEYLHDKHEVRGMRPSAARIREQDSAIEPYYVHIAANKYTEETGSIEYIS